MADYFDRAPEPLKKYAIGAKRYAAARQVHGRPPVWAELVHPDGKPLTPQQLRAETPAERARRVAKARVAIGRSRQQARDVARFGFLPPAEGLHRLLDLARDYAGRGLAFGEWEAALRGGGGRNTPSNAQAFTGYDLDTLAGAARLAADLRAAGFEDLRGLWDAAATGLPRAGLGG